MRVYLSVDMEGIAGVNHPGPTGSGHNRYPAAVDLMVGETNAAIAGAVAAGADDILVNDSHGSMFNLLPMAIDPAARVLQGQKAWSMVEGAGPDGGFDVALFVGYHARAGHARGNIAHTYSMAPVETRLNGRPTGEYGLNAMMLGAWGIPVGLVAGDDALAEEVADWLPWAERVVVKTAAGGNAAASVHPTVVAERIRSASERAVRAAAAGTPPTFACRATGRHRGRLQPGRRGGPRGDRARSRAVRRSGRSFRVERPRARVSRLPGRKPAGERRRAVTQAAGRSSRVGAAGPYCAQTARGNGPAGRRIEVHVPATLSRQRAA